MLNSPRFALGTVEGDVDLEPLLWSLVEVSQRLDIDVQTFASQARFTSHDGVAVVSGQRKRHLDSWLMSPAVCRELFFHGARSRDLSIVEGAYDVAKNGATEQGGSLDKLCDWLDLPQVVVLDAARLRQGFAPQRPHGVAAVLIDKVADRREACRLQTTVEALWGVPVLGMLDELPAVRAVINGLRSGCAPSRELCRVLAERLAPRLRFDLLWKIAAERPLPPATRRLFTRRAAPPLNVAVAYDDVFQCYFQDTLDLLDLRGATIRDFSPLKDERLPPQTDLVYIGCGHPEYQAAALSANYCMREALRSYARAGGRVFAEGGGLAYLAEQLQLQDGRRHAMAGLLPMTALVNPGPQPPQPATIKLSRDCWLGSVGSELSGYLNSNYLLSATGDCRGLGQDADHRLDLVGEQQVIASRMHVNFAVQAWYLERFFHPAPSRQFSVVT